MKFTPQKIVGPIVLFLSLLACRPVIAIGWEELLIIIFIIAFLLGPTLYKVYRLLDKIRKAGDLDKQKKKKM